MRIDLDMELKIDTIKKINLAKYLYNLAQQIFHPSRELSLFAGINLLHDSVEAFLLGLAEHIDIKAKPKATIPDLIQLINNKIDPKELPLTNKLLKLNTIRINSKHHAIKPEEDEAKSLFVFVEEFFSETASNILGSEIHEISLINFLEEKESKTYLKNAEDDIKNGKFFSSLLNCRKAIFLEIERNYDIAPFNDEKNSNKGLLGPRCDSPYYAKNKKYIEEKVDEPTEYIVYEHAHLERELIVKGVDVTEFWNVWRLTPKVYKGENDKHWAYTYDPEDFKNQLEENAYYVFNSTINVLLAIETNQRLWKGKELGKIHYAVLKSDSVSVYKKADKKSQVIGKLPDGVKKINIGNKSIGFDGDVYYRVIRFKEPFLFGFIHNEEIESIEEGIAEKEILSNPDN